MSWCPLYWRLGGPEVSLDGCPYHLCGVLSELPLARSGPVNGFPDLVIVRRAFSNLST
jgi:hypothetical protein